MKFYYENKNAGYYRVYDMKTCKFTIEYTLPHAFHTFKDYENSDKGLLKYIADFKVWNNDLKTNNIFKLDYEQFKKHDTAVDIVFTKKLVDEDFTKFEEPDMIEFGWIEKCNNGSIQKLYCKKNTKIQSYGYDFKSTYGYFLGNKTCRALQMPTKRGKEYILTELDCSKLQVGYYHVEISSKDVNFNKIFLYSKDNVYCDISLYQAFQCSKTMKVNIELIQDEKPNAYLYGKGIKDGIISPHKVFGKWYEVLTKLKNAFPENKLIKHLLSSGWGSFCRFQKLNLTIDEIKEKDLNVSLNIYKKDCDYVILEHKCKYNGDYYVLVNPNKPYHYGQIARLKPFLLSLARRCTANIALLHIDNVIRIHTDNITTNKQFDDVMTAFKTYPDLIVEKKTTGMITWQSVNSYKNHDTGEIHGMYKD